MKNIPILLWCALCAISLRRSTAFLAPTRAFLSLEAFKSASNLCLSRPLFETGVSGGHRGERCLQKDAWTGGAVRRVGLKASICGSGKEKW